MVIVRRICAAKAVVVILGLSLVSQPVWAADITDRSLTITDSAPGAANVNYTFNFSIPSNEVIQSFSAEICTTAYDPCTTPDGFDASDATLVSQPTGFGGSSGWTVNTADPGSLRMSNNTNLLPPGDSQAVTFGGVANPSATNTTYYARITTYANADFTDEIDTGVVTASTAESVALKTFVPPILNFCVGTSIPGDCSTATGNSLDFGEFSPENTRTVTSQMRANTNGTHGYAITVRGTTLTSGTDSIPALSDKSPSRTGAGQFGMNLRDNTDPDIGSDPHGPGVGTYHPDYGTVNRFKFASGDTVAHSDEETLANTFTTSYIVNIGPDQAPGAYSTTLTYICTATF